MGVRIDLFQILWEDNRGVCGRRTTAWGVVVRRQQGGEVDKNFCRFRKKNSDPYSKRGPFSLEHRCRRFRPKSAEIPLSGWPAVGLALFGLNRRLGVPDCRQLPEKVVKKGGYPCLGHVLVILRISGENSVPDWSPRGCKPAAKTVHYPQWVISEVLPRLYLGQFLESRPLPRFLKSASACYRGLYSPPRRVSWPLCLARWAP